jgi:hypothetical protein
LGVFVYFAGDAYTFSFYAGFFYSLIVDLGFSFAGDLIFSLDTDFNFSYTGDYLTSSFARVLTFSFTGVYFFS